MLDYAGGSILSQDDTNSGQREPTLTEAQKELLTHVGLAMLTIQTTETALNVTVRVVFRRDSRVTLQRLEAQVEADRKRTLGYFITELRKRAELHPLFEEHLTRFLEMRNMLVHRISEIPGWDLSTDDGCRAGTAFAAELISRANKVAMVLAALMHQWQLDIGAGIPLPEIDFFKEVEEKFVPYVWALASPKEP